MLVLEPLEFLGFFVASQLTREPIVVTVSLRPPPPPPPLLGELSLAGAVSSRRRTTSIAFSSSTILGCLVGEVSVVLFMSRSGGSRLDGVGLPFGEITRVLPKRVVAAEYVDQGQEDLVGGVVEVYDFPLDAFVSAAEVDFVEDLDSRSATCRRPSIGRFCRAELTVTLKK